MEDFLQLSDRGSSKDIATSNTLHTSRQSVQGCFKPEEGKKKFSYSPDPKTSMT
jgi:hypothetical protein